MSAPTSDQKSAIKFFNPSAGRKVLVEKIPMWRGDHSRCGGHRDGECIAAYGWMIVNNTWAIVPAMAGVSIEPNMMGTAQGSAKGEYAKPIHVAKGWLPPEEAEGVRPSAEVVKFHIDRLVSDRRVTLEHKKAEYAFIERECKAIRDAAEKINAPPKGRE